MTAAAGDGEIAQGALASLCRDYWRPLYAFVRRRGTTKNAAQDLVQGFFANFLRKNYLTIPDPTRGRFRSYLLKALLNYESNERDKENAKVRGGDVHHVPLDFDDGERQYLAEPRTEVDAEKLYERRWALTVLESVLCRLKTRYKANGQPDTCEYLIRFLGDESDESTYKEAAIQLGMSVSAVKMSVLRFRERYQEALRGEIADTVVDEAEIEDEIRFLFAALGRV